MNILYIHQYFKTPNEPGGTRSYWVAQELLKSGHSVTMITSSNTISKKREVKEIDGIHVVYLRASYQQKMSVRRRLKAFLQFMKMSCKEAKSYKNSNLVIATSTPLTVGITALYLRRKKGIPYLFEVRDLWPEVPIQMGAFKNPLIISVTRWLEKRIYKKALHVIALSPGMQKGVVKYIDRSKTSVIPNMAKIDKFWPREKNNELLIHLGLSSSTFKIIHFGSLGLANGAAYIVEAAHLLKDDNTIEFLFVGGGAQEENLKLQVQNYELNNVKFLGNYPMKQLSEIVNIADVSMVSFLNLPILYTNSPNKLFDSLSAGKPILVNSAGWTKDMVEQYKCGFYVHPQQPKELAKMVKHLQQSPKEVEELGKNARQLAETKYDKSILCKQFAALVDEVAAKIEK